MSKPLEQPLVQITSRRASEQQRIADYHALRDRVASLKGLAYWRSLNELADTPEFRRYVENEFPEQGAEFDDPAGRRRVLKLMGASLALAGVTAGCSYAGSARFAESVGRRNGAALRD